MEKISSKFVLKNIISYSSFNLFLKLVKLNKKLQNFLDISLFTYQKIFLLKKIQINYDEINIDKLIECLNKEFKNFNNKNDKKTIEEIIKEIKKDKTFLPPNNFQVSASQQMKIKLRNEINWFKNENVIKLDFKEYYSISEDYIIIPPGIFPNLKVLYMNNKLIAPSSMIINLSELFIDYCFNKKLLFKNDINKEEIDLNNLIYLTIKSSFRKEKNIFNNNNDIISNFNYKIKFHLKKLKQLTINTRSDDNNSSIINYFDLDILNKSKSIKKDENLSKLKSQYFQFESMMNSLNYLSITNYIVINIDQKIIINFEMKTYQNGLKYYWFNVEHFNFDLAKSRIHSLEEKYEENRNKKKFLTFYKNYNYFNDINSISIGDNLNVIKIGNFGGLNSDKINNIFNIKKNNYSVQQIYLNFKNKEEKYYYNLYRNISKFKVLNKLYLFDCIPKYKIMSFIESISKLKLLEQIYVITNEKLTNKEIKSIQKILPDTSVKVDIRNNRTIITQNYIKDNGDDIFFL